MVSTISSGVDSNGSSLTNSVFVSFGISWVVVSFMVSTISSGVDSNGSSLTNSVFVSFGISWVVVSFMVSTISSGVDSDGSSSINSVVVSSIVSTISSGVVSSIFVSWTLILEFDDLSFTIVSSLISSKLSIELTVVVWLALNFSIFPFLDVTFLSIGVKGFSAVLVLFLLDLGLELFFAK